MTTTFDHQHMEKNDLLENPRVMTTHQKIMMGGLGALTPIIMNFLVIDLETTFKNISGFIYFGYAVRVVILFYLGGLVAYLHKDEKSPVRLFELGIIAPALITAFINGGRIDTPKVQRTMEQQSVSSFALFPTVYAQTTNEEKLPTFSPPKETALEQFWRGLTGGKSDRVWFVIAGSHLKLGDAEKQAEQINQQGADFKAEVYEPYAENPFYAVVIGANLTNKEAQKLKRKAIASGLRHDTYLWNIPQ